MADKEYEYSIYGSRTGADAGGLQPDEGIHQAEEWMQKLELKPQMLDLLRSLNIGFPINTREEFISRVKDDVPTTCEVAGKKLSIKDMIAILKESDFPIKNEIEAASLMADACPVSAISM